MNGPLAQPGGRDVENYALSADGARVVFRADLQADQVVELFVARSDGAGRAHRLSAPLVAGGDVTSFELAGARAVYRGDQDIDEVFELYGVPLDRSSAPVRLNGTLPAGGDVQGFWPDLPRAVVLFAATDPAAGRERLYRVPLDGSLAPVEIADSGVPGTFPTAFVDSKRSADGSLAVFRTKVNDGGHEPMALLRVLVDGSLPPLVLGAGTGNVRDYQLSADGSRVGFNTGGIFNGPIYAVRTDGSQQVKLNLTTGLGIGGLTADGSRIVFTEAEYVVSAATDGSQVIRHPALFYQGFPSPQITPDEQSIVFLVDGRVTKAPLLSSSAVTLTEDYCTGFETSADSSVLVYLRQTSSPIFYGLYKLGLGPPRLLNGPIVPFRGALFARAASPSIRARSRADAWSTGNSVS